MQDIQSIAGGRTFVVLGGSSSRGTGDRRLRPQLHQALKCPRCDSLNTKFCYYNNYNLSQPRHFCKSCRRYWTKGGVLRNVPVGGGCRKTKQSKAKSSAPDDPPPLAAETAAATTVRARDRKTRSHSSSESSSLTGTTTAAAAEAVSATSSITPTSFFSNTDNKSIITQTMNAPPGNHGFDQQLLEQSFGCGLFSEMGNFASLLTSTTEPPPFECSSVLDQNSHWSQQQDLLEQQIQQPGEILSSDGNAFLCQTVPVDLSALQGRPSGNESFGQLDWQPAADHGMFDLAGAVDQAYWGQNSPWADEDYLP